MKTKLLASLLVIVALSTTAGATSFDKGIEPRKPECPASADGKHHYSIKSGTFHVRIGESDRCEVFSTSQHTCTACGNIFTTPKYDIVEHEYGSTRCQDAGPFRDPPWDC